MTPPAPPTAPPDAAAAALPAYGQTLAAELRSSALLLGLLLAVVLGGIGIGLLANLGS